ncbi:5976_t:CDS:2, partial [Funneliformis geosporum]
DWAKHNSLLPFENRKSASLICHLRKDLQGIVRALKTEFPELRIKEYHGKSDPMEKAQDFSNVEESWKNIDLVAYTSTLKIGDYIFHIEQRSSNVPVTEKGLFQWLLNAKRECLPRELQNRGVFPDIDSIIRNKDMPTIRLWAGMVVSVIEFVPKPEDTMIMLSQTVKTSSSIVKAEEISNISNAFIVNHETAELLENKSKKTLEEMRSLDRYHIMDCYGVPPELLTEDFISKYGNYNHMKWFRAYKQLRDA